MNNNHRSEDYAMYKTLKAAYAAGFDDKTDDQYGGEPLQLKGHTLVRNADRAVSRTEWQRQGFIVRPAQEPHAVIGGRVGGRYRCWEVFRDDQVEAGKRRVTRPAALVPILSAVWAINRHAKRLRERASAWWDDCRRDLAGKNAMRKRELYKLKGRCLHHLLGDGLVAVAGYCRFGQDGDLWAEVLAGGGYTFHRPCPQVMNIPDVPHIECIDAKPRGTGEPRLRDALLTVSVYLAERPAVDLFMWPAWSFRCDDAVDEGDSWTTDGWDEDSDVDVVVEELLAA